MAINYPTSLDSLTNPLSTDLLTSPAHSTQHSNVNDAVEALEAKVGADASAVTTSHDYKLGEVTGTDKAVGKTATQTLTNKTLTAPQINMGSDATGDTYYRTAGGAFARLPIGTSGQILQSNASSIPEWIANPAAADASTTVKGVVEKATSAEIIAGTSAGGTGALLFIGPDAVAESGADKILKLNSSGALPALSAANLTNITPTTASKILVNASAVTVSNTATETTLISQSISGGTLSTSNGIRVRMHITNLTTDNASPLTFTLRLKYGSTTLSTISGLSPISSAVSVDYGFIEGILIANGATGSQRGSLLTMALIGSGSGTANTVAGANTGSASEDSTAAKTLTVTVQWSGSNANSSITVDAITIEKIY